MPFLKPGPFTSLGGSHRAAPAELRFSNAVDEMRGAHQEIQIEGPVLAVFEGTEAVENEGLEGSPLGAKLFMEEKAVAAEAFRLVLKRAVGDAEFAADLAETGAADEAVEQGGEEFGVAEPVGGGEGLSTEVPVTMMTAVPLDAEGTMGPVVEAFFLEAPSD